MNFNDIVEQFACKKAYSYAENELRINKECMDKVLYTACANELVKNIFADIQRIFAYEYNKLQDNGVIDEGLTGKERMAAFDQIILSDEYFTGFDEKFPVFLRSKQVELQNLAKYQREIFENFRIDQKKICKTLSSHYDNIIGISCGRGDLHNGKSVAFICFANGEQLLYKPRNEYNAQLLELVVRFLANGAQIKEYRFTEYYSTDDHAWERIATHNTCHSIDEIKRYYYRSGVLLSAFYFLSSIDMHHENIISDGEYPLVIDCETITSCAIQDEREVDSKDIRSSVLSTSFIPFVDEKNVYGVNISGLLSEKGAAKPTWQQLIIHNGSINYQQMHVEIQKEKNVVTLDDGTTIADTTAREYVISGFKDACYYAIEHKEHFCDLVSDFCASHRRLQFRQLLRSTQAYYTFIQASKHPEMLQDETKQDELFMILSNNFLAGKFGYLRVQHEIAEMKKGNIPLYYTHANTTDLISDGTVVCPRYYQNTPIQTILKKIVQFDEDLLSYQVDLIKMSVALLAEDSAFGKTVVAQHPLGDRMTREYLLENIEKFVNKIKKMAFSTGSNSSTMITLGFSKGNRLFVLKNLEYSLYESGPIPLLLAYYGNYFKDTEAVECAERFLEEDYNQFQSFVSLQKKQRVNDLDLSVFAGIGGLLYLSYNMYALTGKNYYWKKYIDIAEYLLSHFIKRESLPAREYEYLTGAVTSIALICRVYQCNLEKSSSLFEMLSTAVEKCMDDMDSSACDTVGFAHGISGILVNMLSLYQFTGSKSILRLMEQLLEKEDALINMGKWNQSSHATWCNGKSGVLLCRFVLKKANILSEAINRNLDRYDQWLRSEDFYNQNNLCLCHGVFGNIEIAKTVYGDNFDTAVHIPDKLFDNFSDLEWIDGMRYEFNSFMTGNAGIAYTMLELLNAAPPILTLGLYGND